MNYIPVGQRDDTYDLFALVKRIEVKTSSKGQKYMDLTLGDKDGDIDYNDVAHMQVHLGILKRFEIQDKMDNILVESHFIRLGSIAIATNPFELFLDYGNQIKARSVCEQTFLIQLANGSDGYLPTAKAEAGGHYSAFLSSGQVGHVGGEMLVRQTLDNIRDLFKD